MSLVGMIPIPDDHIEPLKTPYIDKAGKKCVFSVPENYFLTLEPRILKVSTVVSLIKQKRLESMDPAQFQIYPEPIRLLFQKGILKIFHWL